MTIGELRVSYQEGSISVREVIQEVIEKIKADIDMNIWIYTLSEGQLESYITKLETMDMESYPLWGIPFAIKDNIDLVGVPTTAGCHEYAYIPEKSAFIVQSLIEQGAIPIGKTNLDQFATGLVGVRSPYGEVHNALKPELISGGSSSGSAVAVARGQVAFALGTDTAGSGRVPALLNGLVGLKTSLGAWSTAGVVPACASLDCVTVFTNNIEDSLVVDEIVRKEDTGCTWSSTVERKESRLPRQLLLPKDTPEFYGDYKAEYEEGWSSFIETVKSLNIPIQYIDTEIFKESASILYDGPWVAERYTALSSYLNEYEDTLFPVTRSIICGDNSKLLASDLFQAIHFLEKTKKEVRSLLKDSVLIMPTAGGTFTRDDVRNNPIQTNSMMGLYTNHCNLLDLAAIALPTESVDEMLPFGVTIFSSSQEEHLAIGLGQVIEQLEHEKDFVELLVCGLHMRGFPLEHQLLELGAKYSYTTQTAPEYKMVHINTGINKPGLIKQTSSGTSFEVEVWIMDSSKLGMFLKKLGSPLGLGNVVLENKKEIIGFICEGYAEKVYEDISEYGGWKNFVNSFENKRL